MIKKYCDHCRDEIPFEEESVKIRVDGKPLQWNIVGYELCYKCVPKLRDLLNVKLPEKDQKEPHDYLKRSRRYS